MKQISVFGLGKLGAPLAACFASKGFRVIGADSNPEKVQVLNEGAAPIYEPGLEELIRQNRTRLSATFDFKKAVKESDATFVVVPTPSGKSGAFSNHFVLEAVRTIGCALQGKKTYHLVSITSTVMPGTMEGEIRPALEYSAKKRCGNEVGLCYNPEFVALGNVIHDFLNPDFVLIGESDSHAGEALSRLYQKVLDSKPPIDRTSFINAEIVKLALNSFVTTKISFANTLARICEKLPGADVDVVTKALGKDSRIGRKYLKGSIGYGGPCFPRDNLAFIQAAKKAGLSNLLAEATDQTNRLQVENLTRLVKSKLSPGGVVGILGLAYKPDSNVAEESQGVLLADILAKESISVVAYDPAAIEDARQRLAERDGVVQFAASQEECVEKSDVLVIATPWEAFNHLEPKDLRRQGRPRLVIDCWRILEGMASDQGIEYIALGRGAQNII